MLPQFLLATVVAFGACSTRQPDGTPDVGDAQITMVFDGHTFAGYENALVELAPDDLRAVGVATDIHGPIDGTSVLAIGSLDPARFLTMSAVTGLPYTHVLFVEKSVLATVGSRPFGAALPELCPVLAKPVLKAGCPGVVPATQEPQH